MLVAMIAAYTLASAGSPPTRREEEADLGRPDKARVASAPAASVHGHGGMSAPLAGAATRRGAEERERVRFLGCSEWRNEIGRAHV